MAERGSEKAPKASQTEAFMFAGSRGTLHLATSFLARKPDAPGKDRRPAREASERESESKRRRTPLKETACDSKKRKVTQKTPEVDEGSVKKPLFSQVATRAATSRTPWTVVSKKNRGGIGKENGSAKQGKNASAPKILKKRNRNDALLIKVDGANYGEVLRKMKSDEKLAGLGNDVRKIRRSRKGELIVELKGSVHKGDQYKDLTEQVLGEGVEVRALRTETTIQAKNLDEVTEPAEVVEALRGQCGLTVDIHQIKLRKGPAGTQIALIRLGEAEARKVLNTGKMKVGWSVCPLSINQPQDKCFKCLLKGHKAWQCKGPDRAKLCLRCGGEDHQVKTCTNQPKCLLCMKNGVNSKHIMGSRKCAAPKTRGTDSQCR